MVIFVAEARGIVRHGHLVKQRITHLLSFLRHFFQIPVSVRHDLGSAHIDERLRSTFAEQTRSLLLRKRRRHSRDEGVVFLGFRERSIPFFGLCWSYKGGHFVTSEESGWYSKIVRLERNVTECSGMKASLRRDGYMYSLDEM
jgi:hypothetical protein